MNDVPKTIVVDGHSQCKTCYLDLQACDHARHCVSKGVTIILGCRHYTHKECLLCPDYPPGGCRHPNNPNTHCIYKGAGKFED